MNTLEQNIINIGGEEGKCWIANLPSIINKLAVEWKLNHIVPVNNMTFNYVAKAITSTNQPVVLKISCDEKNITQEMRALQYFDGNGSIQFISHHPMYHALLLQQAIPGTTLKSLYPSQIEYVMDSYIDTMKKLHSKVLSNISNFCHIRDWLSAIDNIPAQACPTPLKEKAIALKNRLIASSKEEVFLHGDLHHDNILKNKDCWLAIDPKGVVGDAEFEIAAFDFMYVNELANKNEVKNIVENRINMLARKAHLNPQRIKDWVFVRLILMAAWYVEDGGNPYWSLKLAEALAPMTS